MIFVGTSAQTAAARAFERARELSTRQQAGLLLLGHLLLWTWVGWSSRSNFDGPGDMVEAYAWAQSWQWGYYKHPPLSAWVVGLWFSVVPESHLGYSLLTAFNSALGLAGLAVLAKEFLPGRWVLLALAVASLAPGVTTLAMRFNANAVLISSWPWALAFFVRLMNHGRLRDAMGAGLVCALAVLGKYYSGVLLVAMLATALWLPPWRMRLLTAPVGLAVLLLALALAPHGAWLLAQTEGPLQYAQAATGQNRAGVATMRAFTFALAQCVFPALAFLALGLALRGPARGRAFWHAVTAPLRPRADPLWLLALLPVLVTMAATVLTGLRTASVWGLALAAGLALLASSRARQAGAELCLARLWRTLGVVWLLVALLAPMWWVARAALQVPSVAEPREELAQALSQAWERRYGGDIPWVSGTRVLAASVAFYAPEHPQVFSLWNSALETPWVDRTDVLEAGGVIVCELADKPCAALAQTWSAQRQELHVAKQARGFQFDGLTYGVYWIAPAAAR